MIRFEPCNGGAIRGVLSIRIADFATIHGITIHRNQEGLSIAMPAFFGGDGAEGLQDVVLEYIQIHDAELLSQITQSCVAAYRKATQGTPSPSSPLRAPHVVPPVIRRAH